MNVFYLIILFFINHALHAQEFNSKYHKYKASKVLTNLTSPWGIEVGPNKTFYITEKSGAIAVVKNNKIIKRISGIPKDLLVTGQGGLLDLEFHRYHD